MDALIDVTNATGNFVLAVLSPLPEEVTILGAIVMVAWMWLQNLRAWLRIQRDKRRARLCKECDPDTVESVDSLKED